GTPARCAGHAPGGYASARCRGGCQSGGCQSGRRRHLIQGGGGNHRCARKTRPRGASDHLGCAQGGSRPGPPAGALCGGERGRQQGELGIYTGPLPSGRVAAEMPSAVAWNATTDRQGSFAVAGVPAGSAIVVAEHPAFGRGEVEIVVGAASPRDLVVRVEPPP